MKLPKEIAIIKSTAHTDGTDPVTAGYDYADKAAEQTADLKCWPTTDQLALLNLRSSITRPNSGKRATTVSEKIESENSGCALD